MYEKEYPIRHTKTGINLGRLVPVLLFLNFYKLIDYCVKFLRIYVCFVDKIFIKRYSIKIEQMNRTLNF